MKNNLTRILFVDQTAQLGGAELCLRDIVLARALHDSVFLFQHGPLEEIFRSAGVDTTVVPLSRTAENFRKDGGSLRKSLALWDVLRLSRKVARSARKHDVIYANTPKALVVSALAGKWVRKPVIYHLHDLLTAEHFSRSNIFLMTKLANSCIAHVIANSKATERCFRQAGGRTPCSIIYNGFSHQAFDAYSNNRELHSKLVRQSLGIKSDKILVGVFGRLAPWKGQHVAIEAMKNLPNSELILVGDALFGEGEYKKQLLDQTRRSGMSTRVHFCGHRHEIRELMQAADVVVHCSIAPEPFGRVIVEGMLSRRPVIASRGGGTEEIIQDGVTGYLTTPGNCQELSHAIGRVQDATHNLVARAYDDAVARFGIETMVKRISQTALSMACSFRPPG